MNIQSVTTAFKVCDFSLAEGKKAWLNANWSITDKSILNDPAGRVYLLVWMV